MFILLSPDIFQKSQPMAILICQIHDYYSETATTTMKAPRRIIIFLKHEKPNFDTSVFKIDLEREVAGDVSIFLNQDQELLQWLGCLVNICIYQ